MNKLITLNYKPRRWQAECHGYRDRFQVLVLHRRAGKTEIAIMRLVNDVIGNSLELPFYAYVAPHLKQGKLIAWARLKQRLAPMVEEGVVKVLEGDLTVEFRHNGGKIQITGADNPDALRGVRLDGVVIDEVAQVKPEVWDEILQPALSDRKGWALFIGTPGGINLFSELYNKGLREVGWKSSRYTVYDTDTLEVGEIERLRRDMSEAAFAREYLCDFSAAGDDQLISLQAVEEASCRVYKEGDIGGAGVVIGVDPARFGGDRSVIFRRQGLQAFRPIVLSGVDNMELADIVVREIVEHEPDGVFIDAGAGSGVIDRIRQLGYDVIEVPFGGRAINSTLYQNRRSEMWYLMKEWVEAGGSIPDDWVLRQELATPVYWYDSSGRRCLEAKEDIKKRLAGGASPDMADALALTFAYPIRRRRVDVGGAPIVKRLLDHDPYAEVM